jgi:hypothetical protein
MCMGKGHLVKRLLLFGAVLAGLAVSLLALPGQAAPVATAFQDRAVAAGYTTAQAAGLQREVDRQLAEVGGRQVGINVIEAPGLTVIVPLPGERTARELGTAAPAATDPAHGCPYMDMCLWRDSYYEGTVDIRMGPCQKIPMGWPTVGSWVNNQTPGTQGTFYHKYPSGEGIWGKTGRPLAVQPRADWTKVSAVRNC